MENTLENKPMPYIICTVQYKTENTFFPKGFVTYQELHNNRYDSDHWRRATQEEVQAYKDGSTPKMIQSYSEDKKIGSGLWQDY